MNRVYRRQRSVREKAVAEGKFSFKSVIIKQSFISIAVLLILFFVSVSSDETYVFPKKAVRFILTQNTDIKQIPACVKDFINENIRNKEEKVERSVLLDMTLPANGTIESPFGERLHPTDNVKKFHYGVDIAMPCGTNVLCAQKGVAKEVSENDDYGKYIIVDHGDSICTLYAHLESIIANSGDEIDKGQLIAKSGESGKVTGPHLHFEIREGENWLNPEDFIDFDNGGEN